MQTHGIDYANERRKRFYQRFNNIKEESDEEEESDDEWQPIVANRKYTRK